MLKNRENWYNGNQTINNNQIQIKILFINVIYNHLLNIFIYLMLIYSKRIKF